MTIINTFTTVPKLGTPQPQPLPGHDAEDETPTGPRPRNAIGIIGLTAEYVVPVLAVGAAMAGANRTVAGAIAGFGITFGGMAVGISGTGPNGPASPGVVKFDEIAHNPAFAVPAALMAPVGGGIAASVVAYQPNAVYNPKPADWAPARFAVGALWGGLAGIAAGGLAWGGTAIFDSARNN